MADYLLDTNHASPLVTVGHPLRQRVLACYESGDTFALCVPVVTETLFGIRTLPRAAHNLAEWRRLRTRLDCYTLEEADAERASELQIALRHRGRQFETVASLIAAIALRYQLVLLTTDRDFEPVPGLRRENWVAAAV